MRTPSLRPLTWRQSSDVQLLKVVLIGQSGAGKTSIAVRFARNVFLERNECTIGGEYHISKVIFAFLYLLNMIIS